MRHFRAPGQVASGLAAVLAVAMAAASCSSTSTGESGSAIECAVCNNAEFSCAIGPSDGTAVIVSKEASGCSGTISAGTETDQLWIHCDRGQICVEHEDECFDGDGSSIGFSYTVPGKDLKVTCTRK